MINTNYTNYSVKANPYTAYNNNANRQSFGMPMLRPKNVEATVEALIHAKISPETVTKLEKEVANYQAGLALYNQGGRPAAKILTKTEEFHPTGKYTIDAEGDTLFGIVGKDSYNAGKDVKMPNAEDSISPEVDAARVIIPHIDAAERAKEAAAQLKQQHTKDITEMLFGLPEPPM